MRWCRCSCSRTGAWAPCGKRHGREPAWQCIGAPATSTTTPLFSPRATSPPERLHHPPARQTARQRSVPRTMSDPAPADTGRRIDLDALPEGWQRAVAASTNGAAWALLDGRELSPDEAFDLLGRAYASAHFRRAATGPTSIQSARAAWLCSCAHAVIGDASAAMRLADHCARLTDAAGADVADFDRVYALEATARALAALGQRAAAADTRQRARDAAQQVADDEDRADRRDRPRRAAVVRARRLTATATLRRR